MNRVGFLQVSSYPPPPISPNGNRSLLDFVNFKLRNMSRSYDYWISQQEEPELRVVNDPLYIDYTHDWLYPERGYTEEEWQEICRRQREQREPNKPLP